MLEKCINFIFCYSIILCFHSCGISARENDLEARILELENQLNECHRSDSVLIGQILNAYDKGNYDSVEIYYQLLHENNPHLLQLNEAMAAHYEVIQMETNEIRETVKDQSARASAIQHLKRTRLSSGKVRYENPYFEHFDSRNLMSLYIDKAPNSSPVVMVKLSYKGNDWIAFNKAILSYDGKEKEIPFSVYKHKETLKSVGFSEWIKVPVNNEVLRFLRSFVRSTNAKMTLKGKHTESRTLTYNERRAITAVLNGYDALLE